MEVSLGQIANSVSAKGQTDLVSKSERKMKCEKVVAEAEEEEAAENITSNSFQ